MSLRLIALLLPFLALPRAASADDVAFKPVVTRSVAANRIAETPDYAHALGQEANWLVGGLESRTRYERRWEDYNTPSLLSDDALVTRNLLFLSVRGPLDPFRLAFELEDSRRFFSDRPNNPNIENGLEVLQAYLQLHFDEGIGGQPLSLSAGRMSFDWVDRRLLARNRNRNALSAFDGLRLRAGDDTSPWEVDVIAFRPVERNADEFDQSNENALLAGVAGYWRAWSPWVVLEPFWLWLDQDGSRLIPLQRQLHSFGLHAFGQWGERSAWDYDLSFVAQTGTTQERSHHAWAAHVEAGHTWATAWKPRLALWLNYASGDNDPADNTNEHFDPLFGATYAFYGFSGYFSWQNMVNPALRLSFQPFPKLRCECVHRAFWLADSNDAWVRGLRRDPSGASGNFIGQESNLRIVWQVTQNFEIDFAYARLFPGSFVANSGPSPISDFLQIAGTLRF